MELKPCPFCGERPELVCNSTEHERYKMSASFYLLCPKCGVRTKCYDPIIELDGRNGDVSIKQDGAKKAVEAWNRRVNNG